MTTEPKMKDDPDWQGHNSKAYRVTAPIIVMGADENILRVVMPMRV